MKKIALLLTTLLTISSVHAEPYTIERSEVLNYVSEDKTREYELFIKTPRSYSSENSRTYPVIFLNDGGYSFPLVSSITRQMSGGGVIEEPIIVGISYDKKSSWKISRTRDYTPTKSLHEKIRHSDEARKHSGGGADYLHFIDSELMPFLRKQYRIDSDKEIYAGHSFAGLFGGFILKTKPDVFDYYIVSDPSFWYHEKSIFDIEQSGQSSKKISVLITSQSKQRAKCTFCMAQNAQDFSNVLRTSLPTASIEYLELENEIHETLFPVSVSRGLRRFLSK